MRVSSPFSRSPRAFIVSVVLLGVLGGFEMARAACKRTCKSGATACIAQAKQRRLDWKCHSSAPSGPKNDINQATEDFDRAG